MSIGLLILSDLYTYRSETTNKATCFQIKGSSLSHAVYVSIVHTAQWLLLVVWVSPYDAHSSMAPPSGMGMSI